MTGQKILVIKLGALGDFIYALGPMAAIRAHHKDDHITLLTTAPYADLAQQSGYFDEIWIDEKPKVYQIPAWFRLHRTLNAAAFSRVYDLQNNDRTAIYFRLFSPRPEWVGAVEGASHRNASPERSKNHAFLGHAATLRIGGIENVQLDPLDFLKGNTVGYGLKPPYVLLVSGSSPQNPEKRWPVEHFRTLAAKLIRHGYQPVLLGTKDEAEITARIARGLDVLDLTGKTKFFDLPELARGAVAAIGNDTGPMHICAVTGLPVVMVFCTKASTPKKHGPPVAKAACLAAEQIEDIKVQDVFDAFQAMLDLSGDARAINAD